MVGGARRRKLLLGSYLNKPHWTVLRRLGFWSQNLTLHAIIAQHIVHIKGNIIIFALEISKLEKNCLKVGKNRILCSDFDQF